MTNPSLAAPFATVSTPADRRPQLNAVVVSLAVHGLALGLLIQGFVAAPAEPPSMTVLRTQMISLPEPAPPAPAVPPAPSRSEPEPPVPAARPEPVPQTQPSQPVVDEAALARKRVETERQAQREAAARERRARQAAQREREEQRQHAEAAREAAQREAERLAAQVAAEAAARAEAERMAASQAYLPIRKRAPDYPARALDRRLEGDCTVRYRVEPDGRVADISAEDDCHPLFIRPSLNAARQFRYQPRLVDGQAVAVPNVRNTFHYRIE